MPTISVFYGITIMMHLRDKEHNPPHVHVFYGDEAATINILNGELLEGYIHMKQMKLVREFINLHRDELLKMWNGEPYRRIEGLEK